MVDVLSIIVTIINTVILLKTKRLNSKDKARTKCLQMFDVRIYLSEWLYYEECHVDLECFTVPSHKRHD